MKILYFMHIDWHWIKQRPHFLAEELSMLPTVALRVAHPYVIRRSHLVRNASSLKRVPMLMLPFSRFKPIALLNEWIRNAYLHCLLLIFKPKILWLTFPEIVSVSVLNRYSGLCVVYDCMDDAIAFQTRVTDQSSILDKEKALLNRADVILTSSHHLMLKVIERGACPEKTKLVRNAFNGKVDIPQRLEPAVSVFRFLYFGSIAEYMDFDAIIHCLRRLAGVEFHFVGPISTRCPRHERLIFHAPIEHERLTEFVRSYDCFVMPFKLTELIRGVDPVKLYEYINFNKNILSIYYPELDRFADFATFYKNEDDFLQHVKMLSTDRHLRYRAEQRLEFLRSNTWAARATDIVGYLHHSESVETGVT